MRFTRILLSSAVLTAVMLIAAVPALPVRAQEGAPSVPHAIPGRVDCLSCHGKTVEIGEGHQGRTDDTCTLCHRVSDTAGIPAVPHPTQGREKCLGCHAVGKIKPFPSDHTFQSEQVCLKCHQVSATAAAATPAAAPAIPHATAGREDCVSCHGPGQVRPFPADHQGRTNDMCMGCHQPAAQATVTPVPVDINVVPTPISEPTLFGENTCVTCHEGLGGSSAQNAEDWKASIHAAQGVGCVSCHGGDPNQAEAAAAMSSSAGFLGVPPKGQIPGLCASCHSDVELMRPYNIATDQFAQYWQSQHGQALVKGDGKVATCFDCHGGHKVLNVKDPAATVYPTNEPGMCAVCHADTTLMGTYNIPTNQYTLYQTSVHGVAVLQNQDPRAPTCSTCHGVHGAAPPGLTQVATVCGQCHSKTQDYYQQGAHKTGLTGQGGPGCATCHGQHDVAHPTLDLFLGTEDRHCGQCHASGSPAAADVGAIYQALKGADDAYAAAEAAIAEASAAHLIVTQQQETLQKANTPLIEAGALQHTVNVTDIQAKAKESVDLSAQAQGAAEAALKDIGTRRIGMYVAVAVILVTILALVLVKRELDRRLEADRARRSGGTSGTRPE